MKLTIYHNPRCRKSREALQYLEATPHEISIVNYFDAPLSSGQLEELMQQLDYAPEKLIRTAEAIWKSDFKGKDLSNKELVNAMLEQPKLMERPIISNGKKAVIARPIEKLINFLK
ncbi:MAG: arsenate reductase (glutaredoxin) [Flavobacteriaceae bacterium]|nr:arsenate reductase (glutaredoxin) [Flavobacteriaceae bacterium]